MYISVLNIMRLTFHENPKSLVYAKNTKSHPVSDHPFFQRFIKKHILNQTAFYIENEFTIESYYDGGSAFFTAKRL